MEQSPTNMTTFTHGRTTRSNMVCYSLDGSATMTLCQGHLRRFMLYFSPRSSPKSNSPQARRLTHCTARRRVQALARRRVRRPATTAR